MCVLFVAYSATLYGSCLLSGVVCVVVRVVLCVFGLFRVILYGVLMFVVCWCLCVFERVCVFMRVPCCVVLYGLFLCVFVSECVFGLCVCVAGCGVLCDALVSYM